MSDRRMTAKWASKLGFVLAAAGSAIGLGAIWKFPYVAGTSGGGAFFLVFVLFTILLGYPLLLGEFVLGRKSQSDAIGTYQKIAPGTPWVITGWIGIAACFLVLSFYSVIGGWILLYIIKAVTGSLSGLTQAGYGELFGSIIQDPLQTLAAQLAFIIMTILVVAKGVQKGIERVSSIMMPLLFILFIALVLRALTLEHAIDGVRFLLVPDFGSLTPQAILFALGQAFFTLTLGVSVMVTYSSYLSKSQNLPKSALSIVIMNLAVTLLAGLAIFPAVFSFGLQPDQGPTLLFAVLPAVFDRLPFGMLFFIGFLTAFLFAALTSAFSMIEIIVAAITKGDQTKRGKWTWTIGLLIFAVGIPSCLSYGMLDEPFIFKKTFFDAADYVVSIILMPLGALFISIFIPLKLSKHDLYEEMKSGSKAGKGFFIVWFYLLRFLVPLAIVLVFLNLIGVFSF
ncbi:sodium-dependent transporter [Bacillus licheniformis]|jgi:NSS family neurotransmitter:Na+ symporter|uniref:sodium-dependent transporter n=1 Tax=Bacillus licheniformis TaxID=1402 RepID=UPI0005CE3F15|nr:sodium-dependent transporter [Bacillus licheniformis]AOP14140.1 Sodium-dependent neutral amino acid transporter B(0)AT2 [Bacillus licheniformis]MBS2760093.1 sodium-dependent transporter [Bacillus licheniformis]MCQ5302777.1 sodium-dependent transporter [Bacillus licheniformis]MEC0775367.1 sodium-dependent transporter [Bacillus licheniformis]MEC1863568.1 sodium-dependent transporter [Bacillus licheniformis]